MRCGRGGLLINNIEQLLVGYETGRLSRRDFVAALLTVTPGGAVAAQPAVGAVASLNHVTIHAADVQKSVEFYQRLFGLPEPAPEA